MDAALRSAVDQCEHMPAALVRRRDQMVGLPRVLHDIRDARVFADRENLAPRLAAVGGFEEPAIAARTPERTLGGDVDDIRITGVDQNLADVFGLLEANICPRPT